MDFVRLSRPWIVIPPAALLIVLPLILHGCSCGHDFDFHLVSWFEAAAQFRAGTFNPRWAFSPAWNAGEPRFVFYPPLSWQVGGALGLLLPWNSVPVVFTWLALVIAGSCLYFVTHEFAGGQAAMLASAVYMANPYMVFTAYERTAYAELLAAAWIALLLRPVLRNRMTVPQVAVPVALLWLTNAPAAVMGCYALAVLTLAKIVSTSMNGRQRSDSDRVDSSFEVAWKTVAGVVLGLGLAAYYVLPAAYERRWVQIAMATIPGMKIGDNFLFQRIGDGPHDEVLRAASYLALLLLSGAGVALGIGLVKRADGRRALVPLAALSLVIGIMLTPCSAVLWRMAPEMQFLQFPWRLTAILAAVFCAALAYLFESMPFSQWVAIPGTLVLVAAISLPAASRFRQACDAEDTVETRLTVFDTKTGSDPTDEYTPENADNDALTQGNPPYWIEQERAVADQGQSASQSTGQSVSQTQRETKHRNAGPVLSHFSVDAAQTGVLVLNLRDYPAWQLRLNGTTITQRVKRADGLVALSIPAGHSAIDLTYLRNGDQWLGIALSGVSLLCLLAVVTANRRVSRSRMIVV